MKIIKGPSDYSTPPTPPESNGVEKKTVSKFESEPSGGIDKGGSTGQKQTEISDSFEKDLREIAQTSGAKGPDGEASVHRIVDTVLQEVLGKDFMSRPEAARLKEAIAPMISQDEQMMNKLNSILSRLGKP